MKLRVTQLDAQFGCQSMRQCVVKTLPIDSTGDIRDVVGDKIPVQLESRRQ